MPDLAMRREIEDLFTRHMAYLTDQLAAGQISAADWQVSMREDIRRAHALQMIAGAGGDVSKVAPDDWLRLGSEVRKQDRYLQDFARQMLSGEVDPATAASRAQLYAKSAAAEYSKQATKDVDLPAHPGDGSTACLGNCGCEWEPNDDGSYTWRRGKQDSCEDCLRRESEWAHYVPATVEV